MVPHQSSPPHACVFKDLAVENIEDAVTEDEECLGRELQ